MCGCLPPLLVVLVVAMVVLERGGALRCFPLLPLLCLRARGTEEPLAAAMLETTQRGCPFYVEALYTRGQLDREATATKLVGFGQIEHQIDFISSVVCGMLFHNLNVIRLNQHNISSTVIFQRVGVVPTLSSHPPRCPSCILVVHRLIGHSHDAAASARVCRGAAIAGGGAAAVRRRIRTRLLQWKSAPPR